MTILIVDDSATNLKLLKAQLEAEGVTVLEASNGQEGLKLLAHTSVEAIISDVLMPKMDGYEFCVKVRKQMKFDSIVFVFYSATYTSPGDEQFAVDLGADGFFKKPCPVDTMLDYIKSHREATTQRPRRRTVRSEESILREYSDRLVAKLEERNIELLQRTEELGREIAERKWAEKSLKESEEHYRLLFKSNPLPMWVFDSETLSFLEVNEAAVKHYEYSREEFLRMTIKDIRPPEELPQLLDDLAQRHQGLDRAGTWKHQKKDGTVIDVEITSHELLFAGRKTKLVLANDITDRKRAEKELRTNEERKDAILKSALDGIITMDHEGKIVEFNPAAEKIFGYTRQEVIGKEMAEFIIPPHLREQHRYGLKRYLATGEGPVLGKRIEMPALRADGTEFPVELSIVRVGRETPPMFTGFIRDITERKLAEEALKEREQHLHSIYDTAGDVIFVLEVEKNERYKFSSVNKSFQTTTGIPSEVVVGKYVNEIIPQPSLNLVLGKYKEAIQEKKIVRWEETSQYPTGLLTGEVSVAPVFDKDGNCIHLIGAVHDITERKQAEEAVLNAEKRYRTTLDHMLEGCQIISFDWHYLYINDVAATQGRRTKEELLGRTMMEIYPGIENTQMFAELRRCMKERIPHRMENEFTFADGTKGWFHLSIEPVPEGVFILAEDITKEKQLQEELRKHREHLEELVKERTAQLEAANTELEAFSYSVSHDLRAPLRHIGGFVQILRKNIAGQLDEKSQRHLSIISEATNHMGQLIDDLLVFSRMGRAEMMASTVNLENLVHDVKKELEAQNANRNVHWKIESLPTVPGDPSMLKLAFVNLLSNAMKYSRPREEPRIEVVAYPAENGQFVIAVKDNGVGFDMNYAHKLFGVFQRLHSSDQFEGTGIGLATVRRIIQRHGGRTWAEGKPGEGAAFYCTLPITQENGS